MNDLNAEPLVDRALDLPTEERDQFLVTACAGDQRLLDEARSLLRACEKSEGFLETPAALPDSLVSHGGESGEPTAAELAPVIPGLRTIRLLGRGGMGTVYLAEQAQPKRLVALKVMNADLGKAALQRFRQETEVLARLRHPGIAQIHLAGEAVISGRSVPYFVMELVDGQRLTEYAPSLSIDDRLRLLGQVCDAVDHAHKAAVIHRDLKPSNILVDTTGQPHVLDFGIARVAGESMATGEATLPGQVVGTVEYMSPEQAAGQPVDARSDVYALGVIAYEVLTGRLPYDLAGKPFRDKLATIQSAVPDRVDTCGPVVGAIISRALHKDPQQRYADAGELGVDLRRHLDGQPTDAHNAYLRSRRLKVLSRFRAVHRRHDCIGRIGVVGHRAHADCQSAIDHRRSRIERRGALHCGIRR